MRIISHKNIKYNYHTFLDETITNPILDGISFDILMTKDKKILIYTPNDSYISSVDSIQSNTYENLKNTDIISLEEALLPFIDSNKKIILNLLPIISNTLTSNNYMDVNRLNNEYVLAVNEVLTKFPKLQFYLCSAYDNLVYQIKRLNNNHKVGFVITNLSTSYIDVDFYVFIVNVLDERIINQQISLGKEVMIYILNCDDMNAVMKGIIQRYNNNTLNIKSLNEVYFISNYPELFWKLFN